MFLGEANLFSKINNQPPTKIITKKDKNDFVDLNIVIICRVVLHFIVSCKFTI